MKASSGAEGFYAVASNSSLRGWQVPFANSYARIPIDQISTLLSYFVGSLKTSGAANPLLPIYLVIYGASLVKNEHKLRSAILISPVSLM